MATDIKTVDLTVAVPMRFLGKEDRAIKEKLNRLKTRYVPEVDGVLIEWSDLSILNDKGILIDDQPFIFWRISFTARVFKPIVGKIIKGKIDRILQCYFIAKAMNSFTVTVTIPDVYLNHDIVKNLMLEQEVYFKIKGSSEHVYRGEVDEECLELISNQIKQDQDAKEGEYFYAKDFEY